MHIKWLYISSVIYRGICISSGYIYNESCIELNYISNTKRDFQSYLYRSNLDPLGPLYFDLHVLSHGLRMRYAGGTLDTTPFLRH